MLLNLPEAGEGDGDSWIVLQESDVADFTEPISHASIETTVAAEDVAAAAAGPLLNDISDAVSEGYGSTEDLATENPPAAAEDIADLPPTRPSTKVSSNVSVRRMDSILVGKKDTTGNSTVNNSGSSGDAVVVDSPSSVPVAAKASKGSLNDLFDDAMDTLKRGAPVDAAPSQESAGDVDVVEKEAMIVEAVEAPKDLVVLGDDSYEIVANEFHSQLISQSVTVETMTTTALSTKTMTYDETHAYEDVSVQAGFMQTMTTTATTTATTTESDGIVETTVQVTEIVDLDDTEETEVEAGTSLVDGEVMEVESAANQSQVVPEPEVETPKSLLATSDSVDTLDALDSLDIANEASSVVEDRLQLAAPPSPSLESQLSREERADTLSDLPGPPGRRYSRKESVVRSESW